MRHELRRPGPGVQRCERVAQRQLFQPRAGHLQVDGIADADGRFEAEHLLVMASFVHGVEGAPSERTSSSLPRAGNICATQRA